MFLYSCQQNLINTNQQLKAVLKFICSESHKLTNSGIYYARHIYFKIRKIVNKFDLINEYKSNQDYQVLYSQVAQQSLISVAESFKSFKALDEKYKRGELINKPKLPQYRKSGFALVTYPKQVLILVGDKIRVPLGTTVKRWFSLEECWLKMPSNLNFRDIKEVRILPRNRCFYAEFVCQSQPEGKPQLTLDKCLGIDTGINNWLTCISNVGTSFIIDGKHLKSVNQWCNKLVSNIKENKPQGFWSNRLAALTKKGNHQMRYAVNKAARLFINHCLQQGIGTIVFGWNKGQRREVDLGKKTNLTFVQIPTAKRQKRIAQMSDQ
jgi:transposase